MVVGNESSKGQPNYVISADIIYNASLNFPPRHIAYLMPTLSYCKSKNNFSLNLLLLKVVYLYQDYNSTENQVPLIYGMTYMTNRNRKERYK